MEREGMTGVGQKVKKGEMKVMKRRVASLTLPECVPHQYQWESKENHIKQGREVDQGDMQINGLSHYRLQDIPVEHI